MYSFVIFVFFVASGVLGQTPGFGHCPSVTTVPSFDINQYSGQWYEIQRSRMVFELFGKCVTANYNVTDDGSVKVVNSQISTLTGQSSSIVGTATADDNECENNSTGCAKLIVTFPAPIGQIKGHYWVLGTDYTSYAVVWSCTNYIGAHAKFLWILTRDQNPSSDVMDNAFLVIKDNGIDKIRMSSTDQKNCPE